MLHSIAKKYIPKNNQYILNELQKIKNILDWQSTMFRRENHKSLTDTLDNLIKNVKINNM
jgi:hypothetical protein